MPVMIHASHCRDFCRGTPEECMLGAAVMAVLVLAMFLVQIWIERRTARLRDAERFIESERYQAAIERWRGRHQQSRKKR